MIFIKSKEELKNECLEILRSKPINLAVLFSKIEKFLQNDKQVDITDFITALKTDNHISGALETKELTRLEKYINKSINIDTTLRTVINRSKHLFDEKCGRRELKIIKQIILLIKEINESSMTLNSDFLKELDIDKVNIKNTQRLVEEASRGFKDIATRMNKTGTFESEITRQHRINETFSVYSQKYDLMKKEMNEKYTESGIKRLGFAQFEQEYQSYKTRYAQSEKRINLLALLKDAYEHNDQEGISSVLRDILVIEDSVYNLLGTHNKLFLYTNITDKELESTYQEREFENVTQGKRISTYGYAQRIINVYKREGLRSSARQLRQSMSILGVSYIKNVFAYFDPIFWEDDMAILGWRPDGYCVLEYKGGVKGVKEAVVFCPYSFKPSEMVICFKNPDKISDDKKKQRVIDLIKILNASNMEVKLI